MLFVKFWLSLNATPQSKAFTPLGIKVSKMGIKAVSLLFLTMLYLDIYLGVLMYSSTWIVRHVLDVKPWLAKYPASVVLALCLMSKRSPWKQIMYDADPGFANVFCNANIALEAINEIIDFTVGLHYCMWYCYAGHFCPQTICSSRKVVS